MMHLWRCYDAPMRTTITLDPDVEELVRREMHERRVSFKQAVNDGLRSGLRDTGSGEAFPTPSAGCRSGDGLRAGLRELRPDEAFETPTFDLGTPRANLDRALALAGALEDEERLQRLAAGR
jgi:hypothetical protein